MKTKNRLLLTSAMMLALVAVSGTTATYAWWVTAASAEAKVNEVTAQADASVTLTLTNVANTEVDNTVGNQKVTAKGALTDVTTKNGVSNFQKAAIDSQKKVADLVDVNIADQYAKDIYYAISFKATVAMAGLAEGLTYNVYLGDGLGATTLITEPNGSDKAARMSVSTAEGTFIVGNGENGYTKETVSGETTTYETANYENPYKKISQITEVKSATEVGTFGNDEYCVGTLTSTKTSLDITFTMWFEGAKTTEEVTNNDKFEANLYFYTVRVGA